MGECDMAISTTITRQFFDMKIEDLNESGFFIEFKEFKKFWIKQLDNFNSNKNDLTEEIVFLVGSEPYRFKAISIWKVHREFIPERYSTAITTDFAYAIKCVPCDSNTGIDECSRKSGIPIWNPEVDQQ